MEIAAVTRPDGLRIGADTEATPTSRSETDCARPRRRTAASTVALKRAFCNPKCRRSGSSHASRIWAPEPAAMVDRKSTRLNSSHVAISYAVFCLKKKTKTQRASWRNEKDAHEDG